LGSADVSGERRHRAPQTDHHQAGTDALELVRRDLHEDLAAVGLASDLGKGVGEVGTNVFDLWFGKGAALGAGIAGPSGSPNQMARKKT